MKTRSGFFLAISLVGPIVLLWAMYREGFDQARFPQREDLVCEELEVVRVEPETYGLTIHVNATVNRLFYARRNGEVDRVMSGLALKSNQPLTLCYRPQRLNASARAISPEVFEIRSKQRMIRSLDEVQAAWGKGGRSLWILIPLVLLGSTFLAYRAGTLRQARPKIS